MPTFLPGPGRLVTFTPEPASVRGTPTGTLVGRLAIAAEIIVEWGIPDAVIAITSSTYRVLNRRR